MGRPINKRYFGATGAATATIPARAYLEDGAFEGYITAQKGTNKFAVSNDAGSVTGICRLVNEIAPNANGEMSLVGIAAGGDPIIVKKLFNRTAVDWDNNRYTWEVQDDSTESLLVLTAI